MGAPLCMIVVQTQVSQLHRFHSDPLETTGDVSNHKERCMSLQENLNCYM